MRIAIVGSRNLKIENIDKYIPSCSEIVSGGAKGVDQSAAEYAQKNGIKLTLFLPDYSLYGRAAPIVRNKQIVEYADKVIIFWDGSSNGTLSVINLAKKAKKEHEIIICK